MRLTMDKQTAAILGLLTVAALVLAPVVSAAPINPNLSWSPNPTTVGGTTTATYGVNSVTPTGASDPDCPAGQTFTGTLTVTEPAPASGVSTVTVGSTPCGTTNLTSVYPTAFTGVASTATCGTYAAVWAGTTSALIGGVHPTFSVTDNFTIPCVPVPEFPGPAMMVAALGLVLLVGVRKVRLLKL